MNYNDVAKALVRRLDWDNRETHQAFVASGRELSKSRVAGYFKDPHNDRYREMRWVDLQHLVLGVALRWDVPATLPLDWDALLGLLGRILPDLEARPGCDTQELIKALHENDH